MFDVAQSMGCACSLYSAEAFEYGQFRPRSALAPNVPLIYHGWMMTPESYQTVYDAVKTTPQQFMRIFTG